MSHLAAALGKPKGTVGYHLNVLEAAGLRFAPVAEAEIWRLLISGPEGFYLRREFSGPGLSLSLVDVEGLLPQLEVAVAEALVEDFASCFEVRPREPQA